MNTIVKDRKKNRGQLQKFLAEKCGYDEKTFSMLINGRKLVTDVDIDKFCRGMEVSPNDLFQNVGNESRVG